MSKFLRVVKVTFLWVLFLFGVASFDASHGAPGALAFIGWFLVVVIFLHFVNEIDEIRESNRKAYARDEKRIKMLEAQLRYKGIEPVEDTKILSREDGTYQYADRTLEDVQKGNWGRFVSE